MKDTTYHFQAFFLRINDNPKVSLGFADYTPHTRRIDLKDDYHKDRMDMLAFNPPELVSLEFLAKTSTITARKSQINEENTFNNAAVRGIAIAVNSTSASTELYTVSTLCFQHFNLRQIRKLRSGQPNVDFDAADK